MKYRLNFGNGQVSNTFDSKRAAMAERAMLAEYSRRINQAPGPLTLQFRDPDTGEWFACGTNP
jgi:hypothetical protein